MFCGECGARNPDTNQFCNNCGKPLGRRQTAVQPAVQPAPAPVVPVQPPGMVSGTIAAAAPKRPRNWPGMVSLILGILSWIILTGLFAVGAVLLGVVSLIWFRKTTGRTGVSAIAGIVLGIAAIAVTIALA